MNNYIWSHILFAIGVTAGWLIGGVPMAITVAILAVLEISLSFDNAVVNAKVLKDMHPIWQDRFIKYGIPIAVFGMRFLFPIAIVAIATSTGMIEVFNIAMNDPITYHKALEDNQIGIYLFGGGFLLMVALSFFFDEDKEEHWIFIESFASKVGGFFFWLKYVVAFGIIAIITTYLNIKFLSGTSIASVSGVLLFLVLETIDEMLNTNGVRHGLTGFLYLEVLDASFSFDGVIGAFAITNNIFIIMIGLGIGAMYIRSITIDFVRSGTLDKYKYLEHGAMYAILALAIIMFVKIFIHVPELLTGSIGILFIGIAFIHSYRLKHKV